MRANQKRLPRRPPTRTERKLGAKRITVEVTRSVEALGGFETGYIFSNRQLRIALADYLEDIGLPRRLAARCTITREPEFLEFDSSNPSHACGYWSFEAAVPETLAARVTAAERGFDGGDTSFAIDSAES